MSSPQLVKLEFRIESDDGQVDVETPWAVPLGDNLYQLDNSPFFAYGVSWKDIVEALPQGDGDFPRFNRVVQKSGYRTVRVILEPPSDKSRKSKQILKNLVKMGCTYEGANPAYIVVDVPPEVELEAVADYLTGTGQRWEYADPTYEQLFPED